MIKYFAGYGSLHCWCTSGRILHLKETRKQGNKENMRQRFFYGSHTYAKRCEDKMAEMYRCAVGPQLYRIFTTDSRQVRIEWTLFYLDNIIVFHDSRAYVYWNKASYRLSRRSRLWCRGLSFVFSLKYFFFLVGNWFYIAWTVSQSSLRAVRE